MDDPVQPLVRRDRWVVVGLALWAVTGNSRPVRAQTVAVPIAPVEIAPVEIAPDEIVAGLKAASAELNHWLGAGANGDKWRRYLHAAELESQLARRDGADPAELQRVLARYSGDADGLEKRRFVAVRELLRRWIAQLKQARRNDLPALARASRGDYVPVSAAELAAQQTALRKAASRLQRTLGRHSRLGQGWNAYLGWDALAPHLEPDAVPTSESLAELEPVARRFRTNAPGLDNEVFVATADALDAYRAIAPWALAARVGDPRTLYERNVEVLALQLERHDQRPTSETAWKVGRVLGVVDRLGASPELVAAVRERYARPNIMASISMAMLNRQGRRPVDATRPVRDVILGTQIYGTARTLGEVSFRAVPSASRAEFEVLLSGNAYSRTVGYNGPARIRSIGNVTLSASKRIVLTDANFWGAPALACADANTRICSIEKMGGRLGHRLVEKIGRKRAAQQKNAAERIAGLHAAQSAAAGFDEQVNAALIKGRNNYEAQVRAPLIRRGILPKDLRLSSSASHILVAATLAQSHQLAAGPRRPPGAAPCDVHVQIHESAVGNYLPLALSGVTLTQETADQPPRIVGEAPQWLKKAARRAPVSAAASSPGAGPVLADSPQEASGDPPGGAAPFKPWSLTFNDEAPVSVTFSGGVATLRMRAAVLQSEETQYANWDFLVSYRIERRGNGVLLKRTGDIEVFPTGFDPSWDKSMSSQKSGFRSTLSKNMNARAAAGQGFPAEIPLDAIVLPQGETLVWRELICDEGWLTLGWTLP